MPTENKRVVILPSVVRTTIAIDQILEATERAIARRIGLEIVTSTELLTGTADPLISTAERCGADLACIRDRVAANRIDLALRAVINQSVSPAIVSLHLIDVASAEIVRELFAEAADPLAELAALTRRLFDEAGYPEAARVRIATSPPGAEISFPGAVREGELYLVSPGDHRIDASLEGYLPASSPLHAESGSEHSVTLSLMEEPQPIVSSPWLWLGVGAGALAIAGIIVFVVVDPLRPDCICVGSTENCGC